MSRKTVLITGCSSGIGKGTAEFFEKEGWKVISTSRSGDNMMKLDVTNVEDRRAICDYIENECDGRLDCLVNNAGYGLMGLIESLSDQQIRDCIETNVLGAVFLARDLIPALRKAKGKVLNVSSLFGIIGYPLGTAYCMSKFALNGAMESLRYELSWNGVQVGVIIPGAHKTRFSENMRLGKCTDSFLKFRQHLHESKTTAGPDVVAQTIYKLACKKRIPFKTYIRFQEKIIKYMGKFLPDRIFYWVLKKVSEKLTQDKL